MCGRSNCSPINLPWALKMKASGSFQSASARVRSSCSKAVVLANRAILRNSGRRTARLKSKGDDGMKPWIQPRPSNGASFASRNTSLAGVGVFSFFGPVDTAAFDVELRLGKTKGKHDDMCVRRLDTHSEEMGQSDLSRRIAHRDSGYPVLTILNPFLSPRRLP